MEHIPKGFPARLREARKRRGMTLKDVEEFTGIRISTLSRYEQSSHAPSAENLFWLAKATETTMDYLWADGLEIVEKSEWLPWMPETCKTPRSDGKSLFVRCSYCGGTFSRVLCGESNFCPDCGEPMTEEGVKIRKGLKVNKESGTDPK